MSKKLTRRAFLAASAAGATALVLPATTTLASETASPFEVSVCAPSVPVSSDDQIRRKNAIALEKWEAAVKEALTQRSEICLESAMIEPEEAGYLVSVHPKEVSIWNISCTILYCVMYDATQDRSISDVYTIKSYPECVGPEVEQISAYWAKINHKKTLAALFTTNVTWDPGIYPARTETIATYVEVAAEGLILSC